MFKQLAGLGSIMKQAQQITGRMQGLNEKLGGMRVTGSAGGGMIDVEVNGLTEVLGCKIDEQLIAGGDRELIEDLVVTAMNQAVAKAKGLHAQAMQEMTGDIELPGLGDALGKFLGQGPAGTPDASDDPEDPQSSNS